MPKYDLENLLSDLVTVCKTNLNTKLDAIAAEKNDGVGLPKIDAEAYLFQHIAKEKAAPYPVFVYYAADDPSADGIGPHTLENYDIVFIAILKDTADGAKYTQRLVRYSRALKEIFEEASMRSKVRTKIIVSSITPVSFPIQNLPGSFKGVGVKVKAALA